MRDELSFHGPRVSNDREEMKLPWLCPLRDGIRAVGHLTGPDHPLRLGCLRLFEIHQHRKRFTWEECVIHEGIVSPSILAANYGVFTSRRKVTFNQTEFVIVEGKPESGSLIREEEAEQEDGKTQQDRANFGKLGLIPNCETPGFTGNESRREREENRR